MNARAVAAWSAAGLVVALGTSNPYYRMAVIAAGLILLAAWPRSRRGLPRLGTTLLGAIILAAVFNVLLSHVGGDVMFSIPNGVPLLGGTLTVESLAFGIDVGLGLAAAIVAVAPISLLLESHEVINALPRSLQRVGSVVSASLNLVPGIARSYTAIRDGQLMRGWRLRGPRSWAEVMVPTLLTALEDSVQLAETMEARGYSEHPRSRYRPHAWTSRDTLVTTSAAAIVGLVATAHMAGLIVDWHAYPYLSAPAFSVLLPAVGLLLLAPVLRWN